MGLGYLLFLIIALMAFWMLIFLFGVAVPYWITLASFKRWIFGKSATDADRPDPIEVEG